MPKRKYQSEDLYEFIVVEATIQCSSCRKAEGCYGGDYEEDYFFDKGWRATKDNAYCPECAKKKLKLKS